MSNAAPPGWYPDPWKQAAQRFWDGAQWTHRLAGGSVRIERPRLPEGAPVYGPIIWILALLPLVGAITVWFVHIDISQFVEFIKEANQSAELGVTAPTPVFNPMTMYGPGYWVAVSLGWVSYLVAVLLAYFDWRRLQRRVGVVRPFHWAWCFLSVIVYVIGRSVIVRKVARPRGLAPIWVLIAAYVATIIVVSIWAAIFIGDLFQQLNAAFPTA